MAETSGIMPRAFVSKDLLVRDFEPGRQGGYIGDDAICVDYDYICYVNIYEKAQHGRDDDHRNVVQFDTSGSLELLLDTPFFNPNRWARGPKPEGPGWVRPGKVIYGSSFF